MERLTPDTPIGALRGVGKEKEKAFSRLGIVTLFDLTRHFPRGYQNRGDVKTLASSAANEPVSLILTVSANATPRLIRRGMNILKFRAYDDTGTVEITYFNQPYLKDKFVSGATFRFYGKLDIKGSRYFMSSPIWEECPDETGASLAPVVPVYPLCAGLSQKFISSLMHEALGACAAQEDMLGARILEKNSLPTSSFALNNIHFPENLASLEKARRRMAFDEMFLMSALLASRRSLRQKSGAPALADTDISPLRELIPYELTEAQNRSISECLSDMSREMPMKRILCGDVGSGKTICAVALAYACAKNGYQSAIMAPTEILAKQHFADIAPIFSELGYRAELLCGSMTKAQKDKIKKRLCGEGERIDLIIGTHALLSDGVEFENPALVVTDEQHRFGVMQRAALEKKTKNAHTLVMSATPIPRTLTLVKYGDLDVSRLDELPKGRKKISTFVVDESYRERLIGFIQKQADEGHRTYVVCPAIEEEKKESDNAEEMADITYELLHTEKLELHSALAFSAMLAEKLPTLKIACVHGKKKTAEKDRVMSAFVSGELDVLVATTVIEVGVNVPSATLMVVENAERFGLSQLHQLRGRVGRGSAKSWCILVSDTKAENSIARLEAMKNNQNGFDIAEEDLRLRGPGDFFTSGGDIRQSGDIATRCTADVCDEKLISAAASAAAEVIADDPTLARPEHAQIAAAIGKFTQNADHTVN